MILPPATEFDMLINNDVYFLLKGQINLMSPKVGGTATKTERGKNRSGIDAIHHAPCVMPVMMLSTNKAVTLSDALECRSAATYIIRSSKARDEAIFKVLHLDNETDEHGKYLHISPDDMPIDIGIADELITVFQVHFL